MAARVAIVGILNVTPDSFHDGGRHASVEAAVESGLALLEQGADWIDVGGESTRPGSLGVSEKLECERVLPVIEGLAKHSKAPISIDTRRSVVAHEALQRGASIVNAVAGLRDPRLAEVCAEHAAGLVLNHMRGEPHDMQDAPTYSDVVTEVRDDLLRDATRAVQAGVAREKIWLDPGLGFGKHPIRHNLPLIAHLDRLAETGYPVFVGPSRKRFVGELTGAAVGDRLPGTLAAVVACVLRGARAVRVHDVAEVRQAVRVAEAIREAGA